MEEEEEIEKRSEIEKAGKATETEQLEQSGQPEQQEQRGKPVKPGKSPQSAAGSLQIIPQSSVPKSGSR